MQTCQNSVEALNSLIKYELVAKSVGDFPCGAFTKGLSEDNW